MNFASFCTTDYTLGRGSIAKLGDYRDGKIALVVDQAILSASGLGQELEENILKGCDYKIVCDVPHEPTVEMLKEPIEAVRAYEPKYIVAIGGGSVMDAAKALWLFYELPHYDWEKAFAPYQVEHFSGKAMLTVVPTTSGTGSETTGCAVIKDEQKRKCMILSNEILPTHAILDFDLLKSLPLRNIAFSGTDALAHALEASVSRISSGLVRQIGCQAAVTLIKELPKSYRGDQNAREEVHIAATLAGAAISNAITGMAHGMDFAGGDFNLPHGLMTGMLLPYTMRYLAPQPVYEQVAEELGILGVGEDRQRKLIQSIWNLYDEIRMPKTLAEAGVPEKEYLEKIPAYVERAKADANIQLCPKEPTDEELTELFRQFYYGIEEKTI